MGHQVFLLLVSAMLSMEKACAVDVGNHPRALQRTVGEGVYYKLYFPYVQPKRNQTPALPPPDPSPVPLVLAFVKNNGALPSPSTKNFS